MLSCSGTRSLYAPAGPAQAYTLQDLQWVTAYNGLILSQLRLASSSAEGSAAVLARLCRLSSSCVPEVNTRGCASRYRCAREGELAAVGSLAVPIPPVQPSQSQSLLSQCATRVAVREYLHPLHIGISPTSVARSR